MASTPVSVSWDGTNVIFSDAAGGVLYLIKGSNLGAIKVTSLSIGVEGSEVAVTATPAELNAIAGGGLSAAELGVLDGVTAGVGLASKAAILNATSGWRLGAFATGGATTGALALTAAMDAYLDGQVDVLSIFGASTTDLTSAKSAKLARFRHLVNTDADTGVCAHETYGAVGQIVAKDTTLTHLHAGLMGTFEGHTSGVVLNSSYSIGHAAVIGRIGGHAAITATTPLAGFLAFNNQSGAIGDGSTVAFGASMASSTYPWTIGLRLPVGSVVTGIRIGDWVGSAALGSAIRFSTVHDVYADGQLDVVAVFAESNADLTSAYSAKAGRYRHVINGITCAHETYGLIGQVVAKNVTYSHLHSGLMGTFEVNTAATVSAGDAVGCAGVIGRIGGATITIGATGVLGGVLSVNIATTVSVTSGGVFAAFVCRKAGTGITWAEALHIEDALVALRFKDASDTYAHAVKVVAAEPAGNTSHAIKVMIGTTPGYIPVYAAETF